MTETVLAGRTREPWLTRIGRRLIFAQLEKIEHGEIRVREGRREVTYGAKTPRCPLSVTIDVTDPALYSDVAFGGPPGAGEAYMAGHFEIDDLTSLIRIFVNNQDLLDDMNSGFGWIKAPIRRLLHALNRNTRSGSRRNISAHYDLGNDFFRLFLDKAMMYSSAVYPHENATLDEAAFFKNELLCRKLNLSPEDHVIEIGTGWGGFAIHAASRFGCRVTTTTISKEQYDEAERRVKEAGLEDRVALLLKDYRDLTGTYDKLVSIEMIEAVGHQYLGTYLEKCASLLKPDGLMAIQAITIPAQRYDFAKRRVDFIKRYIFPGGFLPSLDAISGHMKRETDLDLAHVENIGPHYADTLKDWHTRFSARLAEVRAQGYPKSFIRMWEYYFCYCEGAFRERVIGAAQIVASKPGYRGPLNTGYETNSS